MEMTRQRHSESVHAAVYDDCPYCKGRGKVKSALTMSVEIQRKLAEILKNAPATNPTSKYSIVRPSDGFSSASAPRIKSTSPKWRSAIFPGFHSAKTRPPRRAVPHPQLRHQTKNSPTSALQVDPHPR